MKIFGKIPFSMSFSFWMVAALIGYFNTQNLTGMVIWIAVIFVSVLIHELGHASVALWMGLSPQIELIAFGGLTHYLKGNLSLGKQFLVVLAGPVFGLLLFFVAFLCNASVFFQNGFFVQFFGLLQIVNLFWTVVNFIPVLPLDGGQMLRIILEAFFKSKGRYYALLTSALIALTAALFFFFYQVILLGAFFFLFAYQSYVDFKKEKQFLPEEPHSEFQKEFLKAEEALRTGNKEEALEKFRALLENPPTIAMTNLAFQYLAFLEYELGQKQKALDLLSSRLKNLSGESLYLLHKVSFELERYPLVIEISGPCFQSFPFPDVAERAAKSHAYQEEVEPCLGWLTTTIDLGKEPSLDLVSDPIFDKIRGCPAFSKWVKANLT